MIPSYLKNQIKKDDLGFKDGTQNHFVLPEYNPKTHYLELTKSDYFRALVTLRHYIKIISDHYFSFEVGAKNIDLFMLTPSISSPIGAGSDSEALPIKFGKYDSNLVGSSQFGFEPLLLNGIDKVYCYLPSMRGENPDKRHLNQFFHCEAEIKGEIGQLIPIVEGYIKILSEVLLLMPNILERESLNFVESKTSLTKILEIKKFPELLFDEAIDILVKNGYKHLVNFTDFGRDISAEGEVRLAEILDFETPFWIKGYDRDRVPFYQKPNPENLEKVINADLIFPSLVDGSFGGEVAGCGQRQDNADETRESLRRQGVSPELYEWYINLRKLPGYNVTSGFGLGIERFITWALCRDNIRDAIIYPRLKNILTYP